MTTQREEEFFGVTFSQKGNVFISHTIILFLATGGLLYNHLYFLITIHYEHFYSTRKRTRCVTTSLRRIKRKCSQKQNIFSRDATLVLHNKVVLKKTKICFAIL